MVRLKVQKLTTKLKVHGDLYIYATIVEKNYFPLSFCINNQSFHCMRQSAKVKKLTGIRKIQNLTNDVDVYRLKMGDFLTCISKADCYSLS